MVRWVVLLKFISILLFLFLYLPIINITNNGRSASYYNKPDILPDFDVPEFNVSFKSYFVGYQLTVMFACLIFLSMM